MKETKKLAMMKIGVGNTLAAYFVVLNHNIYLLFSIAKLYQSKQDLEFDLCQKSP